MQTCVIEANLVKLNETFKLPYLPELIERKLTGAEKEVLPTADLDFYRGEYERLRAGLQMAFEQSKLPEVPSGKEQLNDLLIRLRLNIKL
jgi:predicted nucleotidyltransferase